MPPACCLPGKSQVLCTVVALSCCLGAHAVNFAGSSLFQALKEATAPSLWSCKLP